MASDQKTAIGPAGAEQQLLELGIELPSPPEPFGTYAEAVQTYGVASLPLGTPVELEFVFEVSA